MYVGYFIFFYYELPVDLRVHMYMYYPVVLYVPVHVDDTYVDLLVDLL